MINSVTICIPTFNEGQNLNDLFESLYQSDLLHLDYEILLCDSGSADHTIEIVESWADLLKIKIISTPHANTSKNLNKGLFSSTKPIFCRIDARARVSKNYFRTGLDYLSRLNKTHCAVGPSVDVVTNSTHRLSNIIARFFMSPFLMGPSHFKRSYFYKNFEGDVDTLYLGFYWTNDLRGISGFDTNLKRKQDIDLLKRLQLFTGKKLLNTSKLRALYVLKHDSIVRLSKRAYIQGTYAGLYANPIRPAHFVPAIALTIFILLLFIEPLMASLFFLIYLISVMVFGFIEYPQPLSIVLAWLIFPLVHLSYVLGNLKGLMLKVFSSQK